MENYNSPDFTLDIVEEMQVNWTKISDISKGTAHVKNQGEVYLPKEPKETPESYKTRLSRAILFNVFNKTVDALSGVAFMKPPKLGDDVPATIKGYAENIDMDGNSLSVFAKKYFDNAIRKGISYAYVDAPKPIEGVTSAADEARFNIRPYWVHVDAENILNWSYETVGGKKVLSHVSIYEVVQEPIGRFGEQSVEQVRVLYRGAYDIYRKNEQGAYSLYESEARGIQDITLVELNLDTNTDPMIALPPLMELCEMNIAHYQIYSDTRHSAHVASVPMLKLVGVDKKDYEAMTIGVNRAIVDENKDAKIDWLSYDGIGVNLNRMLLEDLEQRMAIMGLSALTEKQYNTATEKLLDKSEEASQMAGWIMLLKDALEKLLDYTAQYVGLPSGGTVTVNKDVIGRALTAEQVRMYSEMQAKGQISLESLLNRLKSGEWLDEEFDVMAEEEKLAAEYTPFVTEPNVSTN